MSLQSRDQRAWWRDAVTYQIYIRSFADGNGDGIGDIEGIRSKLPYLKSLGVDAIWITPWYPSPQNDHGYDVSNYMDIEPMYGTLHARVKSVQVATATETKKSRPLTEAEREFLKDYML